MGSLGDRMKQNYEGVFRHDLLRRTPCIVRVDGRAFHTFTRGMGKPFDHYLMHCMDRAALAVARDMQGCKAVYVQSDEASFLLTDYDSLTTEAWFGYDQSKVESLAAAIMTAAFNWWITTPEARHDDDWERANLAHFDARAFSVPREEVVNYFLWRMKDWHRNSVQMYARAHFSHKQLHGKSLADVHEMLHEEGLNWAHLDEIEKNGTLCARDANGEWGQFHPEPNYPAVAAILEPLIHCDREAA